MKNRLPSYRLHKSSGLAVVTLSGKDYYLGKHGSDESIAEYHRLTGIYAANGMKMPIPTRGVTVNELLLRYYYHALIYYRKAGKPTSHIRIVKVVCRRMRDLLGTTEVANLGSSSLLTLRDSWIRDGSARVTVNRKVQIVKRMLDWGVEAGLVPGSVSHAARSIRGLTRGRTTAPDGDPVRPVPDDVLEATLGHLRPRTATMVRLQLLTGMRPGEVCAIRLMDVARMPPVWIYIPGSHKTEHHGKLRTIALGSRAQTILGPWFDGCPEDHYPFSKSGRRPPLVNSYRNAIAMACRKAGIEPWTPNRLRHNFATEVRRRFGLDAAQAALGHSEADVTQVYAELDVAKASEVAAAIG